MFEIDTKLPDEDLGVKLCNFKGRSTKRVYEFNFLGVVCDNHIPWNSHVKVARYSFSGSIPPKFEHKLRRDKQSFGKIATTVVLDKDENLL